MTEPKLDWGSAEVKASKLTIGLAGDIPRGWRATFERTVALLRGGDWGEVTLKKRKIQVAGVQPGSEEKLRHHLEGVILQANADHVPPEDDSEDEGGDDEQRGEQAEDDEGDAEMAERFRSFSESRSTPATT